MFHVCRTGKSRGHYDKISMLDHNLATSFLEKCDSFYLKISFALGNLFVIVAVLCSADVQLTSGSIPTRSMDTASA